RDALRRVEIQDRRLHTYLGNHHWQRQRRCCGPRGWRGRGRRVWPGLEPRQDLEQAENIPTLDLDAGQALRRVGTLPIDETRQVLRAAERRPIHGLAVRP